VEVPCAPVLLVPVGLHRMGVVLSCPAHLEGCLACTDWDMCFVS
jgi:hypothetical protein